MDMNPDSTRRLRPMALLALALLAVGTFAAAPAEAQLTEIHLFTCKVVCGYQLGNVRLLNDLRPLNQPYEDLKPGNYATTCNLYNYDIDAAEQTILPYLAVKGVPLFFLGAFTIPALDAGALGCVDIVNAITPPPTGSAFEGYVTFYTFSPNIRVDGVTTYSSQNAFKEHIVWAIDQLGQLFKVLDSLGLTLGAITSAVNVASDVTSIEFFAASGAGGLGLGASIDIENYERITISLTPDNEGRLPPEVFDAAAAQGLTFSPADGL
jgi:hypothetical protein